MSLPLIVCTTVLIEKTSQAIPLGAACIVSAINNNLLTKNKCKAILLSVTAEDNGYKKSCKENKTGEYLKNLLFANGIPDIVCFSVYVWNRKVLEETAVEIKKHNPKTICIAGGPEITADPFSSNIFDYTIAGEGESVIPQIINCLLTKQEVKNIQGVYIPQIQNISNAQSFLHTNACNLETLESPWLDGTINPNDYGGALWELARGCPFKCSYCFESKGENKVRYFPKERIEKELDLFAAKKVPQVFILDPTYNADKKRALEILRLIKNKAPDMFCYFEARAEFIDKELARAFTQISCSLQIGLQSMHEDVLAKVNRTLNKKLFIRNVGFLNEEGTVFGFDLIYGLPGDSLNGFKESVDFAIGLYPNNLELFCLSVLPGTELYSNAQNLMLTWQHTPPYHVIHTDKFSEHDILQANKISLACGLFYNQGRAVPWFNSVIKALKIKPSVLFMDFANYCGDELQKNYDACFEHKIIETMQIEFLDKKYKEKNIDYMLSAVEDIVKLNGAMSRVLTTGRDEIVRLHYNSDDIMSEYTYDIAFFVKNIKKHPCSAKVFISKNGVDWKNI